ncbi:MAG: hypothetical protein ACPGES_04460 [Coraliomargarita sp.]
MLETHTALILKIAQSGESFLTLHALSPEAGSFVCLKRISSKAPTKDRPDLFDTAEIQLETAKSGTARFVRDYRVVQRRETIGSSYRALQHASDFATLLAKNATHMPDPALLYQLAERSFNAFGEAKPPGIIYLKSIYLLLQGEGYPVRESWWPQVPDQLRESAKALINQPAPEKASVEQINACELVTQNMHRWLQRETDLILA